MAIDRTWWTNLVDDTGTGTTGTVWNKAAIAGLLDSIDGLFVRGTWTPIDVSGAGLALTIGSPAQYLKIDKLVFAAFAISYPSTSNAANAAIGGLPFGIGYTPSGSGITYTTFSDFLTLSPNVGTTSFTLWNKTGGNITNVAMSARYLSGFVAFLVL